MPCWRGVLRERLGISADSGKRWSKKFFVGSFANSFFRTRLKRKGDLDIFMFFFCLLPKKHVQVNSQKSGVGMIHPGEV